jgi:hypothetical protein
VGVRRAPHHPILVRRQNADGAPLVWLCNEGFGAVEDAGRIS